MLDQPSVIRYFDFFPLFVSEHPSYLGLWSRLVQFSLAEDETDMIRSPSTSPSSPSRSPFSLSDM